MQLGGVFIFFREHLAICPVIFTRKNEFLFPCILHKAKTRRSLTGFFLNLNSSYLRELGHRQSHLLFVIGDFNVTKSSWWKDNLTTIEGSQFESTTFSYGLNQLILYTHFVKLMLVDWSYLYHEQCVRLFSHLSCCHLIVHAKLNLKNK